MSLKALSLQKELIWFQVRDSLPETPAALCLGSYHSASAELLLVSLNTIDLGHDSFPLADLPDRNPEKPRNRPIQLGLTPLENMDSIPPEVLAYQEAHIKQNRAPTVYGVGSMLLAVATFFVILRVVSRRIKQVALTADDYLIFAALVSLKTKTQAFIFLSSLFLTARNVGSASWSHCRILRGLAVAHMLDSKAPGS